MPVLALGQALHIFNQALEVASFSLGVFSLYSTFHTSIRITFLKSRSDPGPACLTASVLLLPMGFLQTFLHLIYYQQSASLPLSFTFLVLQPHGTSSPVNQRRSADPVQLLVFTPFSHPVFVEWYGSLSTEDTAKPKVPRPHFL